MLAKTIAVIAVYAACSLGQEPQKTQESSAAQPVPVYRVTVVEHGIDAVNYQYRSAPTKVDFRGTVLLSEAKGEATVQSRQGRTEIDAKFENLLPPTRFGREYLTYVLWAITPEGGSHNIGEIIPDASNRARLRVTTDAPAFAMIVTAEPYSTVRQPSDVVTLENYVRPDTVGKVRAIQPKPELMPRGHYTWQVPEQSQPVANAPKVSMSQYEAKLQLYQAQNAIAIAQAANAEHYAPDALGAAQRAFSDAQRLQATKANSKLIVQSARAATQDAEDARAISERRKQEEELSAARRASGQPETTAPSRPNEANRESPDR